MSPVLRVRSLVITTKETLVQRDRKKRKWKKAHENREKKMKEEG